MNAEEMEASECKPHCFGDYIYGQSAAERECHGCMYQSACKISTTSELSSRLANAAKPREFALDRQVQGNHYRKMLIQPIEYIHRNDLSFLQGNVVKYVTRYKDKGGEADILKAIHYLELILEFEYGKPNR